MTNCQIIIAITYSNRYSRLQKLDVIVHNMFCIHKSILIIKSFQHKGKILRQAPRRGDRAHYVWPSVNKQFRWVVIYLMLVNYQRINKNYSLSTPKREMSIKYLNVRHWYNI